MDLYSFIVAIAGLVGGFIMGYLTFIINYRMRAAAHREMLYSTQVRAYSEIVPALYAFYRAARTHVTSWDTPDPTNTIIPQFENEVLRPATDLVDKGERWSVFLPSKINRALLEVHGIYNKSKRDYDDRSKHGMPHPVEANHALDVAMGKLINVIRTNLGSDTLSKVTTKLFGEKRP